MARKKTKKHHSRRRRISGVGKGIDFTAILGNIGGAALAGLAYNMLTKLDATTAKPKLDPKIAAAILIAGGVLVPRFVGKGSPLVEGIGNGLVAGGGLEALKAFNVISGIPTIAGYSDMRTIQGIPQQRNLAAASPMAGYNAVQVISGINDEYRD